MKLSVSSIAWNESEDLEAFAILQEQGVSFIELVPARAMDIDEYLRMLAKFDLRPVAFQALLFGTQDLYLFKSTEQADHLASHLKALFSQAQKLGVTALVFGSPGNRSYHPEKWSRDQAMEHGKSFFKSLGPIANSHGVRLCLETNPEIYKCNFLTKTLETADFVASCGTDGIKFNFDLGAVRINQENVKEVWHKTRAQTCHVHISEPGLAPVGSIDSVYHQEFAGTLRGEDYQGVVSIEMARSGDDWKKQLVSSISYVKRVYGLP